MAGFGELGLSSWLVEQCRQLGLKQPTPVQLGCIPAILEGECGPASFPGGLFALVASLPHAGPASPGTASGFREAGVAEADYAVLTFRLHDCVFPYK